jgi:hypothetical protein
MVAICGLCNVGDVRRFQTLTVAFSTLLWILLLDLRNFCNRAYVCTVSPLVTFVYVSVYTYIYQLRNVRWYHIENYKIYAQSSSQYISSCPTTLQSSTDLLTAASLRFFQEIIILAMNRAWHEKATVTPETRATLSITQSKIVKFSST